VRGVTSGPDDDSQSFEIFASSPWRLGGQNIECVRFVIECHPIHWCESKVLYHFPNTCTAYGFLFEGSHVRRYVRKPRRQRGSGKSIIRNG
jgi:hypothetical protein